MKKYLSCLLALALACGGEYEEAIELGTLEAPIFMPASYGSEEGDQTRCDTNWSGGRCVVPDSRTITYSFHGCGVPGDPIYDQLVLAFNYVKGVANSAPNSWNLSSLGAKPNPPALPGRGNYAVVCSPDTFGSPMVTSYGFLSADCHDTDRGDLCQSSQGGITIKLNVIDNASGWLAATPTQRNRLVNNMFRHEVGHTIGLGHVPTNQSKLMSAAFSSAPIPGTDPWDNLLTFDATETHALDCYNENSGTGSNCN